MTLANTYNNIIVPQLAKTAIVHGVVLGREVENYRIQPNEPRVYQSAPTLAELRHAYFGENPDGSFVSPEYRQNVLSNRGYGEWTSTFLRDGREVVERPENIQLKNGVWRAEGGNVITFEHFPLGRLPDEGWVLEYDMPTGFPSRTSKNRRDAERVFRDDTSYFWYGSRGLRAVLRGYAFSHDGPFYVFAHHGPGDLNPRVGVRWCSFRQ